MFWTTSLRPKLAARPTAAPATAANASVPAELPQLKAEPRFSSEAAREEARDAQRRGDYEGARERLDGACGRLAECAGPDEDLLEEVEDLRQMSERFRLRTVGEADAKYLTQRSIARTTSRKGSADAISRVRRRR